MAVAGRVGNHDGRTELYLRKFLNGTVDFSADTN